MLFQTIVEHNQSGVEMVINELDKLTKLGFIEGIRCRHRDMYEVEQMTEQVKIFQHRINIEGKALTRFSERFIRQFATDNNKCFETAEVLFRKLRSTIAGITKIFKGTTPIVRRQLPEGAEMPLVFKESALSKKEYTPDMFGLESYPPQVQELYYAIETLFVSASSNLALCHLMMEKEAEVRKDIVQLRQIYKESCDELLGAVKAVSAIITFPDELPENELENLRQKIGSDMDEKFLIPGYHSYNREVMTQYVLIKTIKEARNDGLTDKETGFWKKNHHKALMVRRVIENFDLVKDVEGQTGKLRSEVIVEFLKWCGVPESQEKKLYVEYFVPLYTASGKLKSLGWAGISGLRKQLTSDEDSGRKLAEDFEKRLSAIFPPKENVE